METIHQRIKRLRLARGLTQEQLAEKAGVKYPSVQQWERDKGGTAPTRKRQARVAAALGVSVQELLTGAPEANVASLPHRETGDPRARKLGALFYWLTKEEQDTLMKEIEAKAEANRLIVREIGGKLQPATDKRVEQAIKSKAKKKH